MATPPVPRRRWTDYDRFKLIVTGILLLPLLWLGFVGRGIPSAAAPTPVPAAPTAPPTAAATVAPALLAPAADAELDAGRVTFSGSAAPRAELRVLVDGESVGRVRAGADGSWSLDVMLDKPGGHVVIVQALDSSGEVVAAASPVTLEVVALPALAPPALRLPASPPPAGEVTLAGTGAPGTDVEVLVDGAPAGTAQVAADGSWSLATTLAAGEHEIVVRALDASGQATTTSSRAALTVAAPLAPPTLALPAAGLAAGQVMLSGSGTPGAAVEVLVDGTPAGTAQVDAEGAWSLAVTLTTGEHEIVVRALDASGLVAAAEPARVTVAPPVAPAITAPAEGARLDGGPFTMTGTGAPGTAVEVLDGETVVGTAEVGADGAWSLEITPAGGSAAYAVRPAGGASAGAPVRVTFGAGAETCDALAAGCDVWVTRADDLRLRMRAGAGLDQQVVAELPIGAQLRLLEGPRSADNFSWWRVRAPDGSEGWVAGEKLRLRPD